MLKLYLLDEMGVKCVRVCIVELDFFEILSCFFRFVR